MLLWINLCTGNWHIHSWQINTSNSDPDVFVMSRLETLVKFAVGPHSITYKPILHCYESVPIHLYNHISEVSCPEVLARWLLGGETRLVGHLSTQLCNRASCLRPLQVAGALYLLGSGVKTSPGFRLYHSLAFAGYTPPQSEPVTFNIK